jgi:hypothetical protein
VEQWTTTDVAKRLHRLDQGQTSLLALQNNIDGQTLTTILYTFGKQAHHNNKLCHQAESGGLGLSIQAVNWIQEDVQGFTRTNGFVHYSASDPRSRRLEVHHTVQIQILKGQGLGAPRILAPYIGIVYQRIATEETIQSLRQVLSARADVSPMHTEEGPLTFRQENGIVVFIQNDNTLQRYGITEGSEIAKFWEEEIPQIIFDKENVRYETGEIQFRPTEDRPTFGLLLDVQEDQVRIRWVYEQKDLDKTLLQSLRTAYRIQLHDHELFLSNKLSFQPIKDVLHKATVRLLDYEQERPESRTDQYYIRFHYYIPAPHPSTWTVEEVSENMRVLGCPAAAEDLMIERNLSL